VDGADAAAQVVPKTPATKKILQSNKAIKNWLDDEDAMIQLQQQAPQPRNLAAAKMPQNRRLSTLASVPSTPATPSKASTPAPTTPGLAASLINANEGSNPSDDPLDSLLRPLPSIPNRAELDSLLNQPPLRYGASFVEPPAPGGPPQRYFCDNCGYWGKIRCLKCGARICGLECKDAHEGTRCLKWA
jgi:zinc finger HIT domain-containing protein 1